MSWIEAAPVAAVAVAWLLLPGLLVGYGAGFRGLVAWAVAPVCTIAILAATAVLAGKFGVPWSVPLAIGVSVVAAILACGLGWWVRRRRGAPRRESRSALLAAGLGLLPAFVLGGVTVVHALGRPDALSQTYDAVFHYNALAQILDSHNASSLTLAGLGNPDLPGTFYPAAWHDLTSLVAMTTGASIPAAANLVSAVIAVIGWPLSCLLLVRQIAGPSRLALAVTGLLSVGFTAFPWGLLSFGVLWPNLLGMSLAPACFAVLLSVCGLANEDAIGRGRAWVLLVIAVPALALAHPNVLFGLVALAVFPVGVALVRRAARLRAAGRPVRGPVEILIAVLVFALGWFWAATTPFFAGVRSMYWAPFERPAQAAGEVLVNATNAGRALWILSAIVVVGLVLCARRPGWRWLVGGYLVTAALYVLTAAINRPDTEWITGYWYNDSHRLAAMLPITTVPLAALALAHLARATRERFGPTSRPKFAALAGVGAIVLLVATKGMYLATNTANLATHYTTQLAQPGLSLVDDSERDFFARIRPELAAGSVVAGNPWDGSVLVWALDDRRALIPHLGIALSPQQLYLTNHLDEVATDPQACRLAGQLHVRYLLIGASRFWMSNGAAGGYPGFADPGNRPGFRLVDSDGTHKLYALTGCAA
ncbi:MAG TPA: DUF6541 family protein [Pseudonocardiaceae bacterium]|jgi:hypothetical protein|nr:DUF6541 family protein [Pseudonocardiaceae bacterium]